MLFQKGFTRVVTFFSFVLLAGCTIGSTAGSGLTTTPAVVDRTPIPTIEMDKTPTTTPEGITVTIQSASSGLFLYEADGRGVLGKTTSDNPSAVWIVEDYQGSKRLRNSGSGNYLSIENLLDYVEVLPIKSEWMSPRWLFETDPTTKTTVIRNVWHNWQVLYEKNSTLAYDRVDISLETPHWIISPLGGESLTTLSANNNTELPAALEPIGSRGASVPWVEYEAEAGTTNGQILEPDRTFGTFAAESSSRSAVQLNSTGEFVKFTTTQAANSIVIRYIIPDSEDGTGLDATLSLYINGVFRQKLNLTSRFAWSYGGEELTMNVPAAGGAHHFYDESRALVGDIPAGSVVSLVKDADDTAEYYVIDLLDLEQVEAPKTIPDGYLSIADYGAVANDGRDDGDAIRKTIVQARIEGKGVWIPEGLFESDIEPFEVSEVTIQGAGMWYSTIHGKYARFNCTGNNCRFADFAILGETILRDDKSPENGFNGGAGTGSRLENIWVEHTKVGYWVGPGSTDGLMIFNCRFRNLFADGVNFCNGTSNSIIENSHFRNTGDDAMASWSPASGGVNTNNVFRFNTIQVPWRANCIAIYGGKDNKIEDNLCFDVVTYPGILIAQQFNSNPFSGTTSVQRNSLIRAGGPMFHADHGALKIWADQGDINGLIVKDILIEDAAYSGIEFEGSHGVNDAIFDGVEIRRAGTDGIFLHSDISGSTAFSNVVVEGSVNSGLLNYSPKLLFQLKLGDGNIGW